MKKILIAGIGNIFLGDDGFGCEVIRQLRPLKLPPSVTAMDFGTRSYNLAYALTDGYDAAILVDAVPRGEKPGTVFLIEPEISRLSELEATALKPHSMNPVSVLQLAQSVGKVSEKVFLVGCEPAVLEDEKGELELSRPVRAAIPQAVEMIQLIVAKLFLEAPKEAERVST
jgi:hydrogenase maturation protease